MRKEVIIHISFVVIHSISEPRRQPLKSRRSSVTKLVSSLETIDEIEGDKENY